MKYNRSEIHQKIFYGSILAISFCIPIYGKLLPPLIALLGLNWLIEGKYIKTLPLVFKEKQRFLVFSFSFLYFIYLIGLIYSTNLQYARLDLGIKFSMLLFPLIFATSYFPDDWINGIGRIIRIFALGCIAISIILYGHALYNHAVLHVKDAFYYSNLSWFFHPAYLAMYMTFVISNIVFHLLLKQSVKGALKKAVHILMLVYFSVFVILLSSKAGLIALVFVILCYSLLLGFRYRKWIKASSFLVISLVVLFMGLKVFPFATGRISQAGKDLREQDTLMNSGRSTNDRIGIWKSSVDIILTHPLFGVGTGDVKDELLKEYKNNNIIPAFEQKLNAHNQYLQTFVATGLPGFLMLVSMILIPLWYSLRKEYYLYFFFLLIFGINILFESMLEIQQGVIFYSFFNAILFSIKENGNLR